MSLPRKPIYDDTVMFRCLCINEEHSYAIFVIPDACQLLHFQKLLGNLHHVHFGCIYVNQDGISLNLPG